MSMGKSAEQRGFELEKKRKVAQRTWNELSQEGVDESTEIKGETDNVYAIVKRLKQTERTMQCGTLVIYYKYFVGGLKIQQHIHSIST